MILLNSIPADVSATLPEYEFFWNAAKRSCGFAVSNRGGYDRKGDLMPVRCVLDKTSSANACKMCIFILKVSQKLYTVSCNTWCYAVSTF